LTSMERSVIQLAGKTFVISLPSSWCKRKGVKKGAFLHVNEHGDELCISTTAAAYRAADMTLGRSEREIMMALSAAYKTGYDELRIVFSGPDSGRIIESILNEKLPGYEMTSQTKSGCVIKAVAQLDSESFDAIFSRCCNVIIDMLASGIDAIKAKDWQRLHEISSSEKTLDRITDLAKRLINKNRVKADEATFYYVLLRHCEQLGDVLENLYLHWTKSKAVQKDELAMFTKVSELARDAIIRMRSRNLPVDRAIINALHEEAMKLIDKHPVSAHFIVNAVEAIDELSGPLFALNLKQIAKQ